jgi:hypothetical protein
MAVLDEIQYTLVTNDTTALSESRQLMEAFWTQGGTGREYYQARIVMDLGLWTITQETKYRDDAMRIYGYLLEFWDPSPPYGFWAGLDRMTKTCFTMGYPLLDITAPAIDADPEGRRISAEIIDPNYQWLDLTHLGIGVNPSSVYLFYSLDGQNWTGSMRMQTAEGDTYTVLVPQDVAARNPLYLISASDYFNNTSRVEFRKQQNTVVASSTDSIGISFLAVGGGIAGAALAVGLGLAYRRGTGPAGGVPMCYDLHRCAYWYRCTRRHYAYPTCYVGQTQTAIGCAICYPIGSPRPYWPE